MNALSTWLSVAFFIVGGLLAYRIFIRPLLHDRPQFSEFYTRTDSFWAAVRMKLNTIKTKLLAILLMAGSLLIELHDFLLPAATGVDWAPITAALPTWAWPIISFAAAGLFFWLRKVTAKTHEVEVEAVAAGATPEEAAVIAEKEPA